jgi:hypothetical protein
MKLILIFLLLLSLGASAPEGYQCHPPNFDRIKQVNDFVELNITKFDKDIKSYGKVKIVNTYLPDNGDMGIVVLQFETIGVTLATVVVVLTNTNDKWMITGFTIRDEGLFRFLKQINH